jgi:hypothetical protein
MAAVRLVGHGISIEIPDAWEGRIFCRPQAAPVVHVASFPLLAGDGDFGAAATARMRAGDCFLALVEYRPGGALVPGKGLFAPHGKPQQLALERFAPHQLQVTRAGQLGCQYFFTEAARPCCLYTVIRPEPHSAAQLARRLGEIVRTLRLQPPSGGAARRAPFHRHRLDDGRA